MTEIKTQNGTKIKTEDKIDALLESMQEKTDKSREELLWIGVQLLWNRQEQYLRDD